MRTFLLITITITMLGGCAREGVRPVLSYPRDTTSPTPDDVLDVVAYEENSKETQ